MMTTNIINRRDLEPLWHKANEIVRHYEKAGDCVSVVMGADCIEYSGHPKALLFCSLCKKYNKWASSLEQYEVPCSHMHRIAAKKARLLGGSHIYTCPAGIFFWTSPFFVGERFAGAFFSSVISLNEKQQTLDKLYNICKGDVPRAEIARNLDDVPAKTGEEVQALARIMLLCARHISSREPRWQDQKQDLLFNSGMAGLLDKERLVLASLRRGDSIEAQNQLKEMLDALVYISDDNLEQLKLKAIEMIVLFSRSGVDFNNNAEPAESSSRFIKRIEESKTAADITKNLCIAAEQMAVKVFSFRGIRHASALRKAERFIWENYTRKLSLKEVAGMSGLSVPYFSTIFRDEMGENFSNYLNRLRIEKASSMLRETELPIRGISKTCGFEDQSWFSKIFKSFTGLSPCKYRELGGTFLPEPAGSAEQPDRGEM